MGSGPGFFLDRKKVLPWEAGLEETSLVSVPISSRWRNLRPVSRRAATPAGTKYLSVISLVSHQNSLSPNVIYLVPSASALLPLLERDDLLL